MKIAIDGPAAAGKSSIAKAVAQSLGMTYLDTGAMYRAVAYFALKDGRSLDQETELAHWIDESQLLFMRNDKEQQRLIVNDIDVTDLIRSDEVSKAASVVSAHGAVRTALVALQQKMAQEAKNGVVMDGRDIGTVVLPDADYKFFISADPMERAKRRIYEWQERGIECHETVEEVADGIAKRDAMDENRSVSPLRPASDAILLDTTNMTLDEGIQYVLDRIQN